ncbi:hypothetical protein LPJ78_005411 [Coemansia sp. RSA 989]|nr:hypothetical protein BX667DRAFT_369154 [Coemansia mojavensis]KAJ1861312.1 hypothetical protein LPJ78_005411 [Coemansia sp. RSA 989]KAJ1869370.1 hypothetical protein LPJ55_005396 [Coemansia sp. RSA 990]KAJ2674137.1 hypothetical protein IWW42_001958 [Coemansia sp. RSA 1085]
MNISNKVAVVTGSARGIGKRIVEVLAEKGAKVVVTDILEQGANVASKLNEGRGKVAVFHKCDVGDTASVQEVFARAVQEFGAVDIWVNNAGVGGTMPWLDPDHTSLSRTLDINLKAPIEGTRLAVRYMLANNRPGCIINIASISAFHPIEFAPVYSAAKAGLVSFTSTCGTLAQGSPSIRVNAIAQAFVDTNIVRDGVPEMARQIMRQAGEVSADKVANEVVRCIEDESLAGDTIKLVSDKIPGVVHDAPKATAFGFIDLVKQEIAAAQSPTSQQPKATTQNTVSANI